MSENMNTWKIDFVAAGSVPSDRVDRSYAVSKIELDGFLDIVYRRTATLENYEGSEAYESSSSIYLGTSRIRSSTIVLSDPGFAFSLENIDDLTYQSDAENMLGGLRWRTLSNSFARAAMFFGSNVSNRSPQHTIPTFNMSISHPWYEASIRNITTADLPNETSVKSSWLLMERTAHKLISVSKNRWDETVWKVVSFPSPVQHRWILWSDPVFEMGHPAFFLCFEQGFLDRNAIFLPDKNGGWARQRED